jgi:hypothetical protein
MHVRDRGRAIQHHPARIANPVGRERGREQDARTGFLAVDLAATMQSVNPKLSLFDPDQGNDVIDWFVGEHPSRGNGIIGVKAPASEEGERSGLPCSA